MLVVDEAGQRGPRGEPGEVVIRGYNVMDGYFDDPEATAETIDDDGWLHTGDIGVIDDSGNLRITDRMKDMFIVGGFNAYPAEIENMMMRHPAVGQVAVVGVPDHRMGEVGKAFVVPRAGATVDPDEVVAWCREEMANYKVPRSVEVRRRPAAQRQRQGPQVRAPRAGGGRPLSLRAGGGRASARRPRRRARRPRPTAARSRR